MQTGPAMRESLVSLITAVWYILVYGTSAVMLLASADCLAGAADPGLVRRLRRCCCACSCRACATARKDVSEARSVLTGRIVDTYTNILTVKLFARAREEDAYVREAVDEHTGLFHASLRLNTLFGFCLSTLNALLVTGDRRARDRAVDARRGRGRHRRDGAAAHLADRQHRRLGRLPGHRDLRERRRGAGGHEHDRAADRAHRPAERAAARGRRAARSRSRTCASATAARPA